MHKRPHAVPKAVHPLYTGKVLSIIITIIIAAPGILWRPCQHLNQTKLQQYHILKSQIYNETRSQSHLFNVPMISASEVPNFEAFRDTLSTLILERLGPSSSSSGGTTRKRAAAGKGRKNETREVVVVREESAGEGNGAELSEFVEYLAEEMFLSLPSDLRTLSYAKIQDDAALGDKYSVPMDSTLVVQLVEGLPSSTEDCLTTYELVPKSSSLERVLEQVLSTYIATAIAAPPEHTPTVLAAGCEICGREHLPLTYHHLIPRQMHVKAVKRGWAKEWELNKVAWLCRACHSFVHKIASNEELARELNSVDVLMEREDVMKWAAWVGKVRWKAR